MIRKSMIYGQSKQIVIIIVLNNHQEKNLMSVEITSHQKSTQCDISHELYDNATDHPDYKERCSSMVHFFLEGDKGIIPYCSNHLAQLMELGIFGFIDIYGKEHVPQASMLEAIITYINKVKLLTV